MSDAQGKWFYDTVYYRKILYIYWSSDLWFLFSSFFFNEHLKLFAEVEYLDITGQFCFAIFGNTSVLAKLETMLNVHSLTPEYVFLS